MTKLYQQDEIRDIDGAVESPDNQPVDELSVADR
jgi:hypothetical protein